jgi:glycosyltransferase involved in cell wall biosynthesis
VSTLAGRRLVHVTTTDMSLALLLAPQLRAFAAAGMDVIGVSATGPWVEQLTAQGIRHEALRHATRAVAVGQDALALGELTRLLRRLKPDIVHTHNPKPGLYGRIAARLAGVPVVVNTIHGLYATEDDALGRRLAVYGIERFASMFSGAELLQNVEDIDVLRRLRVPERKIVLLGNGVDLERFTPPPDAESVARARQALGIGPEKVVVGLVGRLVWQKGLRELFDAAVLVRERCPGVVVVVVGPLDDEKADSLGPDDIEAARAVGNIEFLGRRDDVETLYHGFDIFVLPSYREGFPRSAMEAAASGLPVIATDVRGCRQAVDDGVTGLLVPVRDAGALAGAIEKLAGDPDRRRAMGRAGRGKAEAEFDDRRVVETTMAVYERLLERRHR